MPSKSKVLLMGKSGSGKTSMRSIIFANYIPRDTNRLGPTIEVEQAHVRFLGNLVLHLWDCGGQETFMENYLVSQKDQIFKNVQVLIYVFDIDTREKLKDLRYFQACLEALLSNSPNAQVFCLVHKIDLVEESRRAFAFEEKKVEILKFSMASGSEKLVGPIQIFKSSIWDETLYKAWSAIVHKLIPNVHVIEDKLKHFANAIEAVDVVLFEKATFLVIAHAECANHKDSYRLEKISNIIKQFKLSCSRMGSAVQFVHVKNNNFAAFIGEFTANTFIMVILPDANTSAAVTHLNINSARKAFEKLEMSR